MASTQIFLLTCFSVSVTVGVKGAPTDVKEMTANAGDNFTLWTGVQNDSHTILSSGSVTLLNFDSGRVLRIKDNILLDMKRGRIVMLDLKKKDGKDYKLQIYDSNGQGTIYYLKLNVTEHLPRVNDDTHLTLTEHPSSLSPEQRSHLAAYISLGLLAVTVAALILAALWKNRGNGLKGNEVI